MKPTIPAKNKASRDMINQAAEKFAEEPINQTKSVFTIQAQSPIASHH
jgi:hypothetical protein